MHILIKILVFLGAGLAGAFLGEIAVETLSAKADVFGLPIRRALGVAIAVFGAIALMGSVGAKAITSAAAVVKA